MENESTTIDITNTNIEKSDIKKYIEELYKEIKEVEEELDKLFEELEKLPQNSHYDISYTGIPTACRHCMNHPSNGGSGICHCILGSEIKY